jgi:hypothetical protein
LDYLGALEARILAGEGMPAADAVSALALLGTLRLHAGDEVGAEAAFRLMVGRFPGEAPCPPCPECPPTRRRHAPAPTSTTATRQPSTTATWQPSTSTSGPALGSSSHPALTAPTSGANSPLDGSATGWHYAPLGAPQFAQQRPRAGLAWGGAQLVAGGVSIALFAHLGTRKAAIEDGVGFTNRAERQDAITSFEQTQLGLQLPVTFAFYGLWAGSVVEARRRR